MTDFTWISNQGNQGYGSNQNNVIQGQRPDMDNRNTQKEHKVTKITQTK